MLGMGLGLWLGHNPATSGGSPPAAATWATASGANKYAGIVLSSGNLTAAPDGLTGTFEGVRASRAATGTFSYTGTWATTPNHVAIGIDDGTTSFATDGVLPGSTNSNGVCLQVFNGNYYISRNGGNVQGPIASPAPATAQTVTVQCNKSAGTIAFFVGASQIGTTETGVGFTNWYAFMAGFGAGDGSVTADFTSY